MRDKILVANKRSIMSQKVILKFDERKLYQPIKSFQIITTNNNLRTRNNLQSQFQSTSHKHVKTFQVHFQKRHRNHQQIQL